MSILKIDQRAFKAAVLNAIDRFDEETSGEPLLITRELSKFEASYDQAVREHPKYWDPVALLKPLLMMLKRGDTETAREMVNGQWDEVPTNLMFWSQRAWTLVVLAGTMVMLVGAWDGIKTMFLNLWS